MNSPRLSVCITTFNMGHFLPLVLDNIEPIADEIVVLDSHSTDDTEELVRSRPKTVWRQRVFDRHYGKHKNAALEAASGDWILLLDSDELLGDRLRERLPKLIRARFVTHYKLPRYWVVGDEPWTYMRTPKHYPDHQLRLFKNRPFWRYGEDQALHEHFPKKGRGMKRRLVDEHLFHFNFMLSSRSEREQKIATHGEIKSEVVATSEQVYIYENQTDKIAECTEALSGVDHTQLARLRA